MKLMNAIVLAVLLAACGGGGSGGGVSNSGGNNGGGGSNGNQPPVRPDGTVSGVAWDNLLQDADIELFTLGGTLLASTVTDSDGYYSVGLDSVTAQPILIRASGGRYQEEYSNRTVALDDDDYLYAYILYEVGDTITTSVTYLTTLAAGRADYLMSIGETSADAINTANAEINAWVGFDIVETEPVDILKVENASALLTAPLQYAFTTSAVSVTTANISEQNSVAIHEFYNSIGFAQKAYQDIRYDGILNGQGESGQLSLGIVPLTLELYRNQHALNMLVMASHTNNASNIDANELLDAALAINNNDGVIFGGTPPLALDTSVPQITMPSPADNSAIFGNMTFNFSVYDLIGVVAITVTFADFAPVDVADINNPSVQFDTTLLDDGVHPFTISARNTIGGETTLTRQFVVTNTGTSITNLDPAQGQTIRGTYTFSATVVDPIGISEIDFVLDDDNTITGIDTENPSIPIRTTNTLAEDGAHTFKVVATNTVGHVTEESVSFLVDNEPPTFTWSLQNNTYQTGTLNINIPVADNLALQHATLFIDGDVLQHYPLNNSASSTVTYNLNILAHAEGEHTLSFEVVDNAGGRSSTTRTIYFDHSPPTINIQTPSNTLVTDISTITFQANDTLGFGDNDFTYTFNGVAAGSLPNTATTLNLNPAGRPEGDHTITITVTDAAGRTASDSVLLRYRHIAPAFGTFSNVETRGNRDEKFWTYSFDVLNTASGENIVVDIENLEQCDHTLTDTCWRPSNSFSYPTFTLDPVRVSCPYIDDTYWDVRTHIRITITDPYGLSASTELDPGRDGRINCERF